MALLIGSILTFLLSFGFGLSTNLFGDWLHISRKSNDLVSFIAALLITALVVYAGL